MNRLLVVEDNKDYRELLANELTKAGYEVDQTDNPIKGLEFVALKKYDVVISDLNLPIMSGVALTESVKNISPKTACIILTGHPDEASELHSIQKNIDLYIEKNKSLTVLLSYIEKLINEYATKTEIDVVLISQGEDIEILLNDHVVLKAGEEVELTPKEYEILKIFLSNKNKVLSREDFVELAWEEPAIDVDIRLVDSHIKKLRDKLRSRSIMTVRGYGYRWNEME